MKHIIFVTIVLLCCVFREGLSQNFPTNNLIHENISRINPSNYGYAKIPVLALNYQKYWSGISGAPENLSLLAETSLKSNQFGLGFHLAKYNVSFSSRLSGAVGYRQSLRINDNNFVNFGVQLGVEKNQIDFQRIIAADPDEIMMYTGGMSGIIGKTTVGLQYRYKTLQVGISTQLFFGKSFQIENATLQEKLNVRKVPYYTLFFRYPVKIAKDWSYIPSLIIMSTQGLPFNIDNLHSFSYANKIDFGIGYRQSKNLYLHFGIDLFRQVKISYAYQRNLSAFSTVFSNTHEIGIKVYLGRPKSSEDVKWKRSANVSAEIQEQLDQHELRIMELKRRIDSLEKTMKFQKNEILNLKTEQVSKEEINKALSSGNTEKKTQNAEKKSQEATGKKAYEVVSTQNESVIEKLSSEVNNRYFIVLGAFKNLDNAKIFKKTLKRELNYETAIQSFDSDEKKLYLITLVAEYSDVKIARDKLVLFKKEKKEEYSNYLNGEPWLLKIKK